MSTGHTAGTAGTAGTAVPDWPRRAAALAEKVAREIPLRDAGWLDAVRAVPRHVFVPRFHSRWADGDPGDRYGLVDGTDSDQRDRWLAAVYTDETLVTQVTGAALPDDVGGGILTRPTSSSTMPSLIVRMLDNLCVAAGMRVLVIGLGTGYSTALLCHRLGPDLVTSIDVDPALVARACVRLDSLGYAPLLIAGDGAGGSPEAMPFDRIITFVSTALVPQTWIDQLRVGGLVQVDLRGDAGGHIALLRHDRPGRLEGRFAEHQGRFMPMRADPAHPLKANESLVPAIDARDARWAATTVDPADFDHPGFGLVLHLHLPYARGFLAGPDGDRFLHDEADGSWATVYPATEQEPTHRVRYGGPRRLWDVVERAHQGWTAARRPGVERFGLTVTRTTHRLWVDDPGNAITEYPPRLPKPEDRCRS